MLVSLHVKNLALIDELEVYFQQGVNILTGETGAGKSIIMGSINLALGGKANKGLIRTGAEFGLVELVFQIENDEQKRILEKMDIPIEEEGIVVVLRRLMSERNLCKVNGITVSQKQLKEIASLFINIHGQHDNQTLLDSKKYASILDEYGAEQIEKQKCELSKCYASYRKVCQKRKEAQMDEREKARQIALSTFEIEEIKQANLRPGEDLVLEEQYKKMVNARRIAAGLAIAYDCTGYGSTGSAGEGIGRAVRELKAIMNCDEKAEELAGQLAEIEDLLNDFNRSLVDYQQSLEFEPKEFDQVEQRLNVYNWLKEKYGNTVEEILAYSVEKEEELARLADYDLYLEELKKEEEVCLEKVLSICACLSTLRTRYAVQLGERLKISLKELNFLSVELEILVESDPERLTMEGYDQVDFLISVNPGEPLRSISKVASGGELSRIMLALKTVMADREKIGTLIFDEIDAGISGKTAWRVAEKMALLGRAHQILCITHLPQIAAMADCHFEIEKNVQDGRSVTCISRLEEDEILYELARLLGGSSITEAGLMNAKELKDLAGKIKLC